jgi:hypothetical protein
MKKTALVLGLTVLTYIYDKSDPIIRPRVQNDVLLTSHELTKTFPITETSFVQLHEAGMSEMKFIELQKALGKVDIASYAIEGKTPIVLIENLNHNINVKGFNKLIDNFNSLYSVDNEALMQGYQNYADKNCQKIYGCVGTDNNTDYDWKIIKFLPNPEKCNLEPTITMSNVVLY